jgi:general secretion pathway protein D
MLFAPMAARADEASSLYAKGKDLEAKQDYEGAYAFYANAYQLKPTNLSYRLAATRIRVFAALQHVHRGQQLRDQGKLQEALLEFQSAQDIDPGSFIGQQEIRRTQIMISAANAKGGPVTAENQLTGAESARGPVVLAPVADVPISLKMTEDSKVIYATLCKLAGINVVFDPDYKPQRISVDLNGVSLTEALEIMWIETRTFYRPVTPNTIFVAADTPAKRKEIEQNVLKTFYLTNLSETAEIQDVVTTLRTELEVTKISPLLNQAAIVMRGTPDQIALAEKLINDMDKAKPEVVVEVAILQVSREKARNLGIQPPTSTTVTLVGTTGTSTGTGTGGGTGTGTGTGSGTTTPPSNTGVFTLNDFTHLNATNFAVTVPQVSISALASDSNSKLLQNPQIRALDGQKATLKIGQRVPVATGSFSGGGTAAVSALVNTQFQYLDVGVNVDITPRVHANNDVSLKVMLDVSSVDGTSNIGGITQPIIGQHKIEQEIRLKEGEVNVIGGMLDETNSKSLSGYPGLSKIPILRYLFSQEQTDQRENEIIFVLVPRIIRGQELNNLNVRTVDVGTASTIDLRHGAPVALKPVSLAAPQATTPGPAAAAAGLPPLTMPAQRAPVPAPQPVLIDFSPPQITATAGDSFTVDVLINGAQNLFSAPLAIQYDPTKLQLLDASNGDFLTQDKQTVAMARRDDPAGGLVLLTADRPAGASGVSGSGSLFRLKFIAKAEGRATISIAHSGLKDSSNQEIPASGVQALVEIKRRAT